MPDILDLVELLQRQGLDRPQVGAAPFGMPYLQPLPPQHEIRSSRYNTPLAEILGPENPRLAYGVDRASELGKAYATGGYNMVDRGMRHLAEATPSQGEWDYPKAAGGLGEGLMGGLAMTPGGGPLRTLFGTTPRAIGTSTLFGLAP